MTAASDGDTVSVLPCSIVGIASASRFSFSISQQNGDTCNFLEEPAPIRWKSGLQSYMNEQGLPTNHRVLSNCTLGVSHPIGELAMDGPRVLNPQDPQCPRNDD
jgi:hypothetical protein